MPGRRVVRNRSLKQIAIDLRHIAASDRAGADKIVQAAFTFHFPKERLQPLLDEYGVMFTLERHLASMAEAMRNAVLAGRQAYLSGRMAKKLYATASSPLEGVVK